MGRPAAVALVYGTAPTDRPLRWFRLQMEARIDRMIREAGREADPAVRAFLALAWDQLGESPVVEGQPRAHWGEILMTSQFLRQGLRAPALEPARFRAATDREVREALGLPLARWLELVATEALA